MKNPVLILFNLEQIQRAGGECTRDKDFRAIYSAIKKRK